jgi:L-threonylcarbamoyladenylate synthase
MKYPEKGNINSLDIRNAVSVLQAGGLVAFPTDTLYALGANSSMESALEKVYEVKGRPSGMALPILVGSFSDIYKIAIDIPEVTWRLIDAFWPGPLTIILNKTQEISDIISGGGRTVAIRMPNHPIALELIRSVGVPITGTSANISGGQNPSAASDVELSLGRSVDLILDGGKCGESGASTILDLTFEHPKLVRLGVLSLEEIHSVEPNLIVH